MILMYSARPDLTTLTTLNGLSADDFGHLVRIAPYIKPHIPALTDAFYDCLLSDSHTSTYVAGRVDHLKLTHREWLNSLFDGHYGDDFISRHEHIGRAHVIARVPPLFVASSMSFLRAAFTRIIEDVVPESTEHPGQYIGAVLRLLDLCQYLIDRAYDEDRLNRLVDVTGMSRKLLENLISLKQK